jgi:lysophospholipase L1-like esterase
MKLAIALAALPLGLACAEAIVRIGGLAPPPEPRVEGGLFENSSDPRLGYVNRPGAQQTIRYGAKPDVIARVNADGFRSARVPLERSRDSTRIACFGDSHTFGYGVGEGESWPSRLAESLERDSPQRFEVMNCGVNAYDSEQEAALVESVVPRWGPDVVLLQFYINDTAMRGIATTDEDERPGFLMRTCDAARGPELLRILRARSQFLDLCCVGIYNRVALSFYARSRAAPFERDSEGWVRARRALRSTRDLLAREHVAFAVVLYPCLWRENGKLASHDAFTIVKRFLDEQSIAWLDLEESFRDRDVDRLRVDPRDYHAGAEAHRIGGEAIARWLAGSGLLERSRDR